MLADMQIREGAITDDFLGLPFDGHLKALQGFGWSVTEELDRTHQHMSLSISWVPSEHRLQECDGLIDFLRAHQRVDEREHGLHVASPRGIGALQDSNAFIVFLLPRESGT